MSFSLPANTINNNRILHGLTVRQALFQNFQGVRWLYRGMGPEIARIFGSTAMYMGVYSHLRRWNEGRVWYWTIFNSSVASISMWSCMFPFDTMKVSLQTRINDGRRATVADVLRERYGK